MLLFVHSSNCVCIGIVDDKYELLLAFIACDQGEDAFTRSLVYGRKIKV